MKLLLKIFWELLHDDIVVFCVSPLWQQEHTHLIVWNRKPFTNENSNIRIELMKNENHGIFIRENLINSCEKRHDFLCSAIYNNSSLKDVGLKTILNNLSYLHDMKQLKLPNVLYNDLFQYSLSHFCLPEYIPEMYEHKNYEPNYELFFQVDRIFDKETVVWLYTAHNLNIPFGFVLSFKFLTTTKDEKFKMCIHCMKFKMGNRFYRRIYKIRYREDYCYPHNFIQNLMNWCYACRQVPLFQLLSASEVKKQYNLKKIPNFQSFKMHVKTDYYKNGKLFASDPRSKRIIKSKICSICT